MRLHKRRNRFAPCTNRQLSHFSHADFEDQVSRESEPVPPFNAFFLRSHIVCLKLPLRQDGPHVPPMIPFESLVDLTETQELAQSQELPDVRVHIEAQPFEHLETLRASSLFHLFN